MSKRKKILICPLDWGLGHAARDISLIRLFIENNFEPVIASSGNTFELLKGEFPKLQFIDFPSYTIRFSKYRSQVFKMLLLIPKIVWWVIKEHRFIKKLIRINNIDIVFSDNRFGLWNKNVYSIFMTHQLKVKFPGFLKFLEPIYQFVSYHLIKNYDECWIPDYEGDINLSGELSHVKSKLKNIYFIGPLSKFKNTIHKEKTKNFDVLFILSGPEPQRSIFENKIFEQTKESNIGACIVRGTSEECTNKFQFPVYNIVNTDELYHLISQSELIVCRSGYSSVMDLYLLKKKAVLVPTPGQTEQEYLAEFLSKRGMFYFLSQHEFDINKILSNAFDFPKLQVRKINKLEKRIFTLKEMYN
jgi:predicted glycosyltransferase